MVSSLIPHKNVNDLIHGFICHLMREALVTAHFRPSPAVFQADLRSLFSD